MPAGEAIAESSQADASLTREHRVQVRAHDDRWRIRLSLPTPDHVAGSVDAHIAEAKGLEPARDPLSPLVLLSRRRRDLRHGDLLLKDVPVARRELQARVAKGGVMPELAKHGCN